MRAQILSARQVLLTHPWARQVIETRTTRTPLGERLYIVEVKLYRKRVASARLSATLAALAQAIRARGWQHTRIVLAAVFDQPDDLPAQLGLLQAAADATPSVPVIVRCFTLADLQRRFEAPARGSPEP